jgi:hypothetical protein
MSVHTSWLGKTAAIAGLLAVSSLCISAQRGGNAQPAGNDVSIDRDDIGGVVTSAKGPEAGVWVIAETGDLKTKFNRIVVTDEQGRYVLPDLPRAKYEIWVRGYGLVDSPHVPAEPGQQKNLTAVIAPSAKAAADYYPPKYWLALLDGANLKLGVVKDGCLSCHQMGNKATREIPSFLGTFKSSLEAWDHRVKVGPSAGLMMSDFASFGEHRRVFAEWSDRIAAGEFPKEAPPRPSGIERNVVVTQWDWGQANSFSHTHAATLRDNPTVNANGRIYGPDGIHDNLLWLDPVEHQAGAVKIATRDNLVRTSRPDMTPSPYWGTEHQPGVTNARSGVMDHLGRPWVASRIRGATQPDFCKAGSTNKFAQYFPLDRPSGRHVTMWDPRTQKWTLIDTCWNSDHNEFGPAPDHSLFFGTTSVVAWVNSRILDETKDPEAAQGWCPAVLDTSGDGKITKGWTEPDQPVDSTKDHRITFGCYYTAVSPDGSVWCAGSALGEDRRHIVRMDLGRNPPETCKAERFVGPPQPEIQMAGERGISIDSDGVVWVAWRQSDHLTSFDRRKCKNPLNGPQATGAHCPEGWSVHRREGEPTFRNSKLFTDNNYSLDIDAHDWSGLGKNTKLLGSANSDGMQALLPNGQFIDLHIPYPMGFFTRNAHGRIDDPGAGWKGRAIWTAGMSYAAWHQEGGKGTTPKVVKIQVRPSPIAK